MKISAADVRIWGPMIAGAAGGLVLYLYLSVGVPAEFADSDFLRPVGVAVEEWAFYPSIMLFMAGAVRSLVAAVRHHHWTNGQTPSCSRCGDMMVERNGRFGLFWGCVRYPRCRGTRNL